MKLGRDEYVHVSVPSFGSIGDPVAKAYVALPDGRTKYLRDSASSGLEQLVRAELC